MLPVPMTSDLDRYLRTSEMILMILDDNDGQSKDYLYGVAKIPLTSLVFNEVIDGDFELRVSAYLRRMSMAFIGVQYQ